MALQAHESCVVYNKQTIVHICRRCSVLQASSVSLKTTPRSHQSRGKSTAKGETDEAKIRSSPTSMEFSTRKRMKRLKRRPSEQTGDALRRTTNLNVRCSVSLSCWILRSLCNRISPAVKGVGNKATCPRSEAARKGLMGPPSSECKASK